MTMHPNLVAGAWVASPTATANINPSNTDEIVGHYADATPDQVSQAAEAARRAASSWGRAPFADRANLLYSTANAIDAQRAPLALLLSREEGKALRDATGEVARAADIFRFYAGEVYRMGGDSIGSVRLGVSVDVMHEPVGVVGLITPWNFPMAIPAWKIAPALAYGNAVLYKPSELVPACAWALSEIIHNAGAPAGVFNLLMGGGDTGRLIVDAVDAVSFTGSVATGTAVAAQAVRRMIPAQCELGGKNPLVVLADADLAVAVDCAVQGGFMQTGQRCTASSRLIVDEAIVEPFTASLKDRLSRLTVDDGTSPTTDIGPVADARQFDKDLDYIRVGKDEGARLALGGEALRRTNKGYYLSPALFVDTTNDMRINREEIFGPVAAIIPVRGYDEALATANDTTFGLSSSIATTSLKYAQHFKSNIRSGVAMVNLPTAGIDFHVPLSGMRSSAYGQPEMGHHAMRFYTKVRTAYTFAG